MNNLILLWHVACIPEGQENSIVSWPELKAEGGIKGEEKVNRSFDGNHWAPIVHSGPVKLWRYLWGELLHT